MDTIKRLGENETVRRITNGTLKSYVDREIDTVDTSAFINLETLNVPKAESVTIGEGVKDTLEVLNAPKAENIMTYDAVSEGNVEGLGNLPNLKVADVHSADVDVPMFKGCTNLEKATIGGIKGMEPLTVNWGKCGGAEDVIVEYNAEEPLWIPRKFLSTPFHDNPTSVSHTFEDAVALEPPLGDTSVGFKCAFTFNNYQARETHSSFITVSKLPSEIGEYLYDNAEDYGLGPNHEGDYNRHTYTIGSFDESCAFNYKGIAIYPDAVGPTGSWGVSVNWGIGIRRKSDLGINGYINASKERLDERIHGAIMQTDQWKALEEDAYYMVVEWYRSNMSFAMPSWLSYWGGDDETAPLYLRHYNTMDSAPSATNQGEKYAYPIELCIPTLNSSYFEGCSSLKEVVITNPELRFNSAIPSTVELYADDSKLPSDGLLEYSKGGLPPVMVTMATYLQANNSGYRVKGAEELPLGGKTSFNLLQYISEQLKDVEPGMWNDYRYEYPEGPIRSFIEEWSDNILDYNFYFVDDAEEQNPPTYINIASHGRYTYFTPDDMNTLVKVEDFKPTAQYIVTEVQLTQAGVPGFIHRRYYWDDENMTLGELISEVIE